MSPYTGACQDKDISVAALWNQNLLDMLSPPQAWIAADGHGLDDSVVDTDPAKLYKFVADSATHDKLTARIQSASSVAPVAQATGHHDSVTTTAFPAAPTTASPNSLPGMTQPKSSAAHAPVSFARFLLPVSISIAGAGAVLVLF
ncbi:hypothetical protein HKX48_007047 [Thoreauomyces humboldtii]|nr:hypothetical protein HKX48_007047 [Thoreauomyces humboldtii]